MTTALAPRSLLFLPASNPRAMEKARTLPADMILLDLEDAVRGDAKDAARAAAITARYAVPFGIRINGTGSPWHDADCAAVATSAVTHTVAPKVESADEAARIAQRTAKPLLAMIETPAGVLAAAAIAAAPGVAGLIAGTNDLRATLRLPDDAPRDSLAYALQTIVLAARAASVWAFDGVYNRLDDADGFAADTEAGRALGFDGKTLIHPSQIDPCNAAYAPSTAALEDARALIEAATGGAERFRDRMIESMHVEQAHALLARL